MSAVTGPFKFEVQVHLVNDETRQTAFTTVSLGPGKIPELADLHWAIGVSLRKIPGWRLMNPGEFFNDRLQEKFGKQRTKFATPNDWEFDIDALTAAGIAAAELRKSKSRTNSGEEE